MEKRKKIPLVEHQHQLNLCGMREGGRISLRIVFGTHGLVQQQFKLRRRKRAKMCMLLKATSWFARRIGTTIGWSSSKIWSMSKPVRKTTWNDKEPRLLALLRKAQGELFSRATKMIFSLTTYDFFSKQEHNTIKAKVFKKCMRFSRSVHHN